MPVPPWTLIATDAQIARLAGLTLALACTVDDAPAVAVMGIRGGRSVRGSAARCHVTVAQLGARGRPRRSPATGARSSTPARSSRASR